MKHAINFLEKNGFSEVKHIKKDETHNRMEKVKLKNGKCEISIFIERSVDGQILEGYYKIRFDFHNKSSTIFSHDLNFFWLFGVLSFHKLIKG